ncbi:MAG: hypothetical protein U9N34_07110 [Candidatus Cloacimonadota bacterium]|nr:hypothetical protein [Candidatus Cloacimonadota bacterium]
MIKKIIILTIILFAVWGLNAFEYTIPKVLFVTTGDGDGRGTVSDGVILALQEFNKSGAFVRLENRKILHNVRELSQYWNKLRNLNISIFENNNSVMVKFDLETNKSIENLSLKLPQKPRKIKFSGKYHYVKNGGNLFIVLDFVKNVMQMELNF